MKKISTLVTKQSKNFREQKLTIGLDLGDRSSWYCVLDEAGEVLLEQKLGTTPKAMREVFAKIQMRQGHWAAVDLIGKGGHIRTVPIPNWVKAALDQWTRAAGVCEGKIFRAVAGRGKVWGSGLSRTLSGTWSEPAARERAWSTLHRTTCGGPARSCATIAAVN
jgi:hypothetical protein